MGKILRPESDFETLKHLLRFLEPFNLCTLKVSEGNYSNVSEVFPLYFFLLSECKLILKNPNNINIPNFVQVVNSSVAKLKKYYTKLDRITRFATILDPRYNISFFKRRAVKEVLGIDDQDLERCFIEEFLKKYGDQQSVQLFRSSSLGRDDGVNNNNNKNNNTNNNNNNNKNNNNNNKINNNNKNNNNKKTKLNKHQESQQEESSTPKERFMNLIAKRQKLSAYDEVNDYLHFSEVCSLGNSPYNWWKFNFTNYPNVAMMAREYLAAQGTSTASERLFSMGKNIIGSHRQSLLPSNINKCASLKSWLTDQKNVNIRDNQSLFSSSFAFKEHKRIENNNIINNNNNNNNSNNNNDQIESDDEEDEEVNDDTHVKKKN